MSSSDDFRWMIKYMKMLDPVNAKILDGLGKYGPRNISFLAKSISMPFTTVTFRLKKLMEKASLKIKAKPDCSKLGLIKGVLLAESLPKNNDALHEIVENVGYWTYIAKCYGKFNGIYSIFAFPAKYKEKLEEYFAKASKHGIFINHLFFWTTNIWEGHPNFEFFDFKKREWNFQWDEWVEQVVNSSGPLPSSLVEPKAYPVMVDEMDLLILKELEKDGARDFRKIAKVAGVTPQSIRYRFYNHILERKLINEYEITIFPYPTHASDLCSFVINFVDEKALAKFADRLSEKPFVQSYAKIIGENSLLLNTYTPKKEFSNLIQSLNRLSREEIVRNFLFVTLDIYSYKRQTISYEFFKDGDWVYNHEKNMVLLEKFIGK